MLPWQGNYDPMRTAQGGQVWYRLSHAEPLHLQATYSSLNQGALLIYQEIEADLQLLLGGATVCGESLQFQAPLPAGDFLVAMAADAENCNTGWLRLEAVACPPPAGLSIRRLGTGVRLDWEVVPECTGYQVWSGATLDALSPRLETASSSPPLLLPDELLSPRRFYQVRALCE